MAIEDSALQADPAKIEAAAGAIENQRSVVENCFNSIFLDAKRLKNSWEGDSADAYRLAMDKLSNPENKQSAAAIIVQMLREYVIVLNSIAAGFDSAERRNKSLDEALPGDIFRV